MDLIFIDSQTGPAARKNSAAYRGSGARSRKLLAVDQELGAESCCAGRTLLVVSVAVLVRIAAIEGSGGGCLGGDLLAWPAPRAAHRPRLRLASLFPFHPIPPSPRSLARSSHSFASLLLIHFVRFTPHLISSHLIISHHIIAPYHIQILNHSTPLQIAPQHSLHIASIPLTSLHCTSFIVIDVEYDKRSL